MNHRLQELLRESRAMRERSDCAVIAVAISTGVSYLEAHNALTWAGRRPRCGTLPQHYQPAFEFLGFDIVNVTHDFNAKTLRTLERELKNDNYLIRTGGITNGHAVGVYNGQVVDVTKGRCKRIKQVFKVRRSQWY